MARKNETTTKGPIMKRTERKTPKKYQSDSGADFETKELRH